MIPVRNIFLGYTLLCAVACFAQPSNAITVQTSNPTIVINKNIYGHFAEHLGHCIYDGFYVGEQSQIPNIDGVRKDVIEALKKMKIPALRWPGGCFADTYHWKDGIGPKTDRPARVNQWWGGVVESNQFGTHDFLNLCEELGADPYMAANAGSGTVEELTDWVQYVNSSSENSMAQLRAANGRKEPWHVKYWGIGNEAWGCGGNMTPEYYANIYKKYATFMTGWSNGSRLFRVAAGANSEDYHWTEVLMRDIPLHLMEGIGLHHYSVIDWNNKGSATDFTEAQYFQTMQSAEFMDSLVTRNSAIMDKYDPQKHVALVVDEWGGWYDVAPGTNPAFLFQQNTMRDAMIAGVTLNIFNNHADRVRMANLAQTVNVLQAVILTNGDKIILTPTYHVMEMYNVHQNARLLPVTVTSAKYIVGSDTLPAISVSASIDSSNLVHISLVNIDAKQAQPVALTFAGSRYKSVTGRILSSPTLQDHNSIDAPDKVQPKPFKDAKLDGDKLSLKMPPFSVIVLELK